MKRAGLFPSVLWMVGLRYLLRHARQSALMILGVALGVAVVISIDLANASAARAFELSTETLTGKATHQIVGGPPGVPDAVYTRLKISGFSYPIAPVITEYVSSPRLGGYPLQLLGIDPFADRAFRSFLGQEGSLSLDALAAFLSHPGAVILSRSLAERYDVAIGQKLPLAVGGQIRQAEVVGLLDAADDLSRRTLEGVILADISTAQELTGKVGFLSRVDLILPSTELPELKTLPKGLLVLPASSRSATLEQMTAAFRVNLTALSLLALVVGLFLIYNTMTFSVVQRRDLFGTLRCLGVSRREIFGMVVLEAVAVGLVGSLAGVGLGILLGKSTVQLVSQTINDLYFTTTVRAEGIAVSSLVKGALAGLLATVITAAIPAWEAASVPPRVALLRSGWESTTRGRVWWSALAGGGLIGVSVLVFRAQGGVLTGFAGTLLAVLGAALLTGLAVMLLVKLVSPLTGRVFGLVGRVAPRSLLASLSRISVTVTALMVAIAVTIGVSIMIDSFRKTVILWLDETLHSDIYLSGPIYTAAMPMSPVAPEVIDRLRTWPGVERVDTLRSTSVQSRVGEVNLSATDNSTVGYERLFVFLDGKRDRVWERLLAGEVLVSEPLANRLGIRNPGEVIEVNTPQGWHSFRVMGVYYDYASSEGTMLMAMNPYRELWQDKAVTSVGLRLASGIDADQVVRDLQDALAAEQPLVIRANRTLRQDVLMVFDRTFTITVALRIQATVVAFIGVLSALFLLQVEKQREAGIYHALGFTPAQLRRMVFLETGLMGLAAGLLAMPTGYALAVILIYVINKRSFGWTLQLSAEPAAFLQGLLVALVAALLAGVIPAVRFSRMSAAETIRYD